MEEDHGEGILGLSLAEGRPLQHQLDEYCKDGDLKESRCESRKKKAEKTSTAEVTYFPPHLTIGLEEWAGHLKR